MAKKLLIEKGFSYKEIDIEEHNISREEMASMAKSPTVPQRVVDDFAIAGFIDLVQYFESQNI